MGVWLLDGDEAIDFTKLHGLGKAGDGPSLDRVFAIEEDASGNLWFGTVEFGAWRYDGESLTNFSVAEGMPSRHVWSFYVDRRGDLWAAGANPSGVARFDGTSFVRQY